MHNIHGGYVAIKTTGLYWIVCILPHLLCSFLFFFSFLFAPKRVLFNAFSSGSICLLFNFCRDFIYGIRKRWPLWTNRPHKTACANSSMENGNITHLDLNFMSNVDNIKRNVYERQQKKEVK